MTDHSSSGKNNGRIGVFVATFGKGKESPQIPSEETIFALRPPANPGTNTQSADGFPIIITEIAVSQ